jgi:hypothetical protein
MTTSDLSYPLLENGLDYMEEAVERLSGAPTSRDLKYALLHLAAAIEVLLKMRLTVEHWSLVFDKADLVSRDRYDSGDFVSVGSTEAIRRLRQVIGITISKRDEQRVMTIVKNRNRLQHFGLVDSAESIRSVSAQALDFLLTFVGRELRSDDPGPDEPVEETLERIQSKLSDIAALVAERMESLATQLASAELVLDCPRCIQPALLLDGECHCLFCLAVADPVDMAESYVELQLRSTRFETMKDGGMWPIHFCPSCGEECLVENIDDRSDLSGSSPHDITRRYWACFSEGAGWNYGEIGPCMRCGQVTDTGGDGGSLVCSDCIADLYRE